MENKISKLVELVHKLPEDCLDEALTYLTEKIEESAEKNLIPPCPHCKEGKVRRNGHKGGRQRYRCIVCGKTFGQTTNTAMSYSHYGEAVWKQMIRDTIAGISIDDTASSLKISHSTAFNMRHKILLSLETAESREPTVLDGVCELDDTYVLESFKGSKLPQGYWRKPRKHGAKAQKRGISNEYVGICSGVQRDGQAYSRAVTRATPGKKDIITVFGARMGQEALILCDGATSYTALGEHCECPVQPVSVEGARAGKGFYNINTANSYHSFIKERYNQYRGVATKYLNRYNALFSKTFRNDEVTVDDLYNILMSNDTPRHHSTYDVKTLNLLDI
jgi:transposase-like protein